uniref:Uncharacterized protein n=2 Tax=Kalmanozyma brasiliensis (strain GHG001) TaxID=1365824 RepID=V5EXS3_KALBG
MYDTLMGMFANAPSQPAPLSILDSNEPSLGFRSTDEQLWHDICTIPHLGGPTLRTMSARIICHARNRRLDLIQSDLDFVRTTRLGTIHDLTETARLSIVRCCIERGSLLTGFRYTSILLSAVMEDKRAQSRIVTTLLKAAQSIRIPPSVAPVASVASGIGASSIPSRAQLLKRFWRHFSSLHRKFPHLQVGMQELKLVIQLLDRQQGWIETRTLWSMLRVVGRHFDERDARLVRVLEAFVRVFEARAEQASADELKKLIATLQTIQTKM